MPSIRHRCQRIYYRSDSPSERRDVSNFPQMHIWVNCRWCGALVVVLVVVIWW